MIASKILEEFLLYTGKKNNNADVQKYLLFSLFIMRNIWNCWVRERVEDSWDVHKGQVRIFSELFLRSAFERIVQGYLKALNHFSFYLILDFRESRQKHLKAPNHLIFSSLLCFRESDTVQNFLYLSTLGTLTHSQRP